MHELVRNQCSTNFQILYTDTDSAIYWRSVLMPNSIRLGRLLGDWTDELADFVAKLRRVVDDPEAQACILLIIILAPKAYCYLKRAINDAHCERFPPVEYIRLKVCEHARARSCVYSQLYREAARMATTGTS